MKPVTNILTEVLKGDKTTNEALIVLRTAISSCISQTISSVHTHIRRPQPIRGDGSSETQANLQALKDKYNNTLDVRNEQDSDARNYDSTGMTESQRMTHDAGFDEEMPPLFIADICRGIAKDLYVDMMKIDGELDTRPDALIFEPKHPPAIINYDQPQSAEGQLNYRISLPPEARKEEVSQLVAMGEDERNARELLTKEAERSKARLLTDRNAIMTEIAGLDGSYTAQDFVALPHEVQIGIARRWAESLGKRRANLRIRGMRGVTEDAQDAVLIDNHCKTINKWLRENDVVSLRSAA